MDLHIGMTADTRMGLDYDIWNESFSWIELPPDGNITMSPEAWINLNPNHFWFYGGDYDYLWVNPRYGLIWIPSNKTMVEEGVIYPPSYDKVIPNIEGFNSFIAPFWRPLNPNAGGQVIYAIRLIYTPGRDQSTCLVISWIDVPDQHGNLQTFQVIIELIGDPQSRDKHRQSINLRFLALPQYFEVVGFIFQIEGHNWEFKP